MPYVLSEKQREYQRNWAKNKNKNKNKNVPMRPNTVTWEELMGLKAIEKIGTWEKCVSLAKEHLAGYRVSRLTVAAAAQRACIIKHGGRKGELNKATLAAFAKDVDIHRKTLSDWVRIKSLIYDKLKYQPKEFDYQAARMALEKNAGAGEGAVKRYEEFNAAPLEVRGAYLLVRYLENSATLLERSGFKYLSAKEKERVIEAIKKIHAHLDE